MRQRFCQIRSRRIHILTISERGFARVFSSLSIEYKKKDRKKGLSRASDARLSLSFYANVFFFFCARTRIFRARAFLASKKMDKFLSCVFSKTTAEKKNERKNVHRRRRKSRRRGEKGKAKARDDRVCSRRRRTTESSNLPRRKAPKSGDRSSRKGIHRAFAQRRTQRTKKSSSRGGGGRFLPEVCGASDGDDSNSETNQPRRVLERKCSSETRARAKTHRHIDTQTQTHTHARVFFLPSILFFFSLWHKKRRFCVLFPSKKL